MSITKNKAQTMKKVVRLMAPVVITCALAMNAGCATVQEMNAESKPYGEQLKERVAQWDEWCKKEKLGPYLEDPKKKRIGTCDFLFLKDKRWDPNADEFSRYAHSIKLPAPHDKPQAQYREGMTSKEYFEELCAKEAGQWIFRKVEGVEGVLQARPYVTQPKGINQLVPQAKESVPHASADDLQWSAMGGKSNFSYQFFEYPGLTQTGSKVVYRYYRKIEDLQIMEPGQQPQWKSYKSLFQIPYIVSSEPRSRYGYVGRGIFRPEFEANGIVGTELLVVDLKTQEVLALVKNFGAVRPISLSPGQMNQEGSYLVCTNSPKINSSPDFVLQVLIPKK